jgi:hypothetical protein
MTTKKIVIIVATILITLGLLVALFVGGIILFAFQQIGNSDAATTARKFLKSSERLKQDIGDVKDFGTFITGNINIQNGNGNAMLNLKVIGARKTVNTTVELAYRNGREWQVTGASYTNDTGQTVDLLNPYQSQRPAIRLAA